MTRSNVVSEPNTPEEYFNIVIHEVPAATKRLIRAMKNGLDAEKAKEQIKNAMPANTPPILAKALEESICYIDSELSQGGFAHI